MTVFNFISLFGGLALFLYGMRIMGDGLKHGSSAALKKAMEKVTNNPLVGFFLGLVVTAVIQSSTATIVLTSGLVGAGIITLHQSIGIILGANVGTTVTGQIIRLLDINTGASSWLNVFKPSTLAPIAAIIGIILIMAFNSKKSDTVGGICIGFGILFTGLLNMTGAVSPLAESPAFANLFISLSNNPVLGFLAGAGVALSIQSSSATIGILQALSVTGQLTFSSIYSIIVGIYLGDCITTAIVCSIGAKANAKRTGIIHILFNLSEAVIVFVGVTILHQVGVLDSIWSTPITSGGIANAHTLFNLICALSLLPVCSVYEKISLKIVKDDAGGSRDIVAELELLSDKFFSMPAIALSKAHEVVSSMANTACKNAENGIGTLFTYDKAAIGRINESEDRLDALSDAVEHYLIKLSPNVEHTEDSDLLNYNIQCFSEFERIGDYAVNLTECAQEMQDNGVTFSADAQAELRLLQEAVNEIMGFTITAFTQRSAEAAKHIEPIEEVIDNMVETLRNNHTKRLLEGHCSVIGGMVFMNVLTNLERIADQCSNVGIFTLSLVLDEDIETHHVYLQRLHQGDDEVFNTEYRSAYDNYFGRLTALGK